jgi:hypothetical protein
MRGGWTDRYGNIYEEGIVQGKPSALNISITSINPRNFLNELNAKAKENIVNRDRNSVSSSMSNSTTSMR